MVEHSILEDELLRVAATTESGRLLTKDQAGSRRFIRRLRFSIIYTLVTPVADH